MGLGSGKRWKDSNATEIVTLSKVTISEGTVRKYIEKKKTQGTAASGRRSKPVGMSYQRFRILSSSHVVVGISEYQSFYLYRRI